MAVITCRHCGRPHDNVDGSRPIATEEATSASLSSDWGRAGTRVMQASGMVAAQVGCSPDIALRLMKERAEATSDSLKDIATAILERRLRFGEQPAR